MSIYRGPSVLGTASDTTHAMILSATAAAVNAARDANTASAAKLGAEVALAAAEASLVDSVAIYTGISAVNSAASAASASAVASAASAAYVASIATGPVLSVNGRSGVVSLTKADVGLANISSTATQTLIGAGSNANALVIDQSNGIQVAGLNGGQLAGFRNYIINGDMRVSQRGTTFTIVPGGGIYTLDRWYVYNGTNQTVTVSQDYALAFDGKQNLPRLRMSCAVAPTTGFVTLTQFVESVNTLAGKTATYSMRAASGEATTFSSYIQQIFGAGGSTTVGAGTIVNGNLTNSIDSVWSGSLTLPSVTGKTFGASHYIEVTTAFYLRTTNAISITNVQLEIGPVATPFEQRHIVVEVGLCQRYYERLVADTSFSVFAMGSGTGTTWAECKLFYANKRVPPTSITISGSTSMGLIGGGGGQLPLISAISVGIVSRTSCALSCNVANGMAGGFATALQANGSLAPFIEINAEF